MKRSIDYRFIVHRLSEYDTRKLKDLKIYAFEYIFRRYLNNLFIEVKHTDNIYFKTILNQSLYNIK